MAREYIGTLEGLKCYSFTAPEPFPYDDAIYFTPAPGGTGYRLYYKGEYIGRCDSRYHNIDYHIPQQLHDKVWEPPTPEPEPIVKPEPQPEPIVEPESERDFWSKLDRDINAIFSNN